MLVFYLFLISKVCIVNDRQKWKVEYLNLRTIYLFVCQYLKALRAKWNFNSLSMEMRWEEYGSFPCKDSYTPGQNLSEIRLICTGSLFDSVSTSFKWLW